MLLLRSLENVDLCRAIFERILNRDCQIVHDLLLSPLALLGAFLEKVQSTLLVARASDPEALE